MALPKGARTGILLLLTAGPFLVFLFLHLFGENHFELDRYPISLSGLGFIQKPADGIILVLDRDPAGAGCSERTYQQQQERLRVFWEKENSKPAIIYAGLSGSDFRISKVSWFRADTAVETETAKGPARKRLPAPPRAFLFDENQNLRGVYGLCSSVSVDTLMLEYKILIH